MPCARSDGRKNRLMPGAIILSASRGMMQFAKRVWDFCASQDLLHVGDRLVLGVSGGPDSLCLLDVFESLASRYGLALCVAHFNHGLRPEAEADAQFVHAEAARRGLASVSE